MTRPVEIFDVQPKAISTFAALCWLGDEQDEALIWMAERFGWKINGVRNSVRKGLALEIIGKNHKRYLIKSGEYVVALGANGSLRVCTAKEFQTDYRKARK